MLSRFVVELFDGELIRAFMVDEEQLEKLADRVEQIDPRMGVTILSVTPEDDWTFDQEQSFEASIPLTDDFSNNPVHSTVYMH
ncbi:hypothetical protein ACQZV8_02115 [Magnetococcales bacterium HHB-1]